MNRALERLDPLVWATCPFGSTNPAVVVAAARAGAVGLLPVGDSSDGSASLATVLGRAPKGRVGVVVAPKARFGPIDLPAEIELVVLGAGHAAGSATELAAAIERWRPRRVAVEITSLVEAQAASAAGADELVAKGNESGGLVGTTSTFVLLQQLAADPTIKLPFRARGGIGLHTAAAAMVAGAAGVVLDDQLGLAREASPRPALRAALEAMDGSETTIAGGHRIYIRPDLPSADLAEDVEPDVVAARLGTDLRRDLVAMAQDGGAAAQLAERFVTVGGIVQAIATAAEANLTAAGRSRTLAPGAPLAVALGIEIPVAQGPMTRVSDRAGFAAAVAADGALPFLALALLRGPEVRALLEETRDRLGDRPWGVGILGFVPPELREEQLAVVREIGPPVALIAGGRPSQAAPLEAAGMPTFLHVPSPGLLDRFLADGARRFVFEGRECGGHIGPRSSFVLWEAQVQRLLAHADRVSGDPTRALADVQVLLAGGIHDERSAAMAVAVVEPLVARGASAGVLMGTAYLFTDAAVTEGAIQPTFQQVAVDCQGTALLRTAPGHAIRCAVSPFVDTFAEAEQDLIAQGLTRDDRWLQLEELNLGRLRVASKGTERQGDDLVAVNVERQITDGMFMLGDVAALRHRTTTIADLHRQVTSGAVDLLAEMAPESDRCSAHAAEEAHPLDIAIVGMAGVFPGATDVQELWSKVVGGVDAITEVPADRWDAELWHDDTSTAQPGFTTPSKSGGFLPQVPFDALAYGIPPRSLASIEPIQLLALEVAARALANAGYATRPFDRSRASVIFGAEAGTDLSAAYGLRASFRSYLGDLPPELDDHLPRLTEDSFPGLLTNVIAGRIANRLDLGGCNYTVDAACASSLAALDLACKELAGGTSDLVLCGGADLHNGIHDFLLFSSVHALSPGGRCRTFDADADGIALGEGVACVALKRLADAERDGDHIHGVVRAVAGSSDGRHLGLTAPRPEGQELALRRAYERAGISPAEVGLVEAHGTGTAVGDRTELSTLRDVFVESGAEAGGCAVGSVKSNIGHTKCAAGLAGLIKATLAVERGVLPPTLHVQTPSPAHDPDAGPFAIYDEARPWTAERRIAGVSAFGFGGTNFHAVIERYTGGDAPVHGTDRWPSELVVLRGDDDEVAATITAIRGRLAAGPVELRDIARTAWERGRGQVRAAVVATSTIDLADALEAAANGQSDPNRVMIADDQGTDAGRVAFLFPGQGSQRPAMLADLFVAFPALTRHLAAGRHLLSALFPPSPFTPERRAAQRAAVTDTAVAQPGLGMVEVALADLLSQCGVTPDLAAGHSYGEIAALAAAGAIPPHRLVATSTERAQAILEAAGDEPGTMAAVAAAAADVIALLDDIDHKVVVANDNAPRQSVISGPTDAVAAASVRLSEKGMSVKELPVACAFHSPVVAPAAERFGAWLAAEDLAEPAFEVWSNTTARPHDTDPAALAATLASQIAEPVRWAEQVEAMWEAGARTFVEVGPGRVLSGLVGKILGDRTHTTIACDIPGEPGLHQFLVALGRLATLGLPVELDVLFTGRARTVDLREQPATAGWTIDGHLVRTADGLPVAGGLKPITERPTVISSTAYPSDGREEVVHRYLDGMADLVAAQRDVMLAMLGADPAAPVTRPARVIEAAVNTTAAIPAVGAGSANDAVATTSVDLSPEALLHMVLELVGDRTGYPLDMLQPGLDLEADLSIDSIKRIEIIGELFDRLPGMSADPSEVDDDVVEELAGIKTIAGIVDWIVAQADESTPGGKAGSIGSDTTDGDVADHGDGTDHEAALPERSIRYAAEWSPVDPAAPKGAEDEPVSGPVSVIGGEPIGRLLADLLAPVPVVLLGEHDPLPDSTATLVDLTALSGQDECGPAQLLARVQEASRLELKRVLVAHRSLGPGDPLATSGVGGLVRAVARERPATSWRSVAWSGGDDHNAIAAAITDELSRSAGPVSIGRDEHTRSALHLRQLDAVPELHEFGDNADAPVALLTGGAQGITARVAIALAARGWTVELVGRSPLPEDEDEATVDADGDADIRRALVAAGRRDPREIESEVARIRRDRKIRATLADLEDVGANQRYHQADVRDGDALAAVVHDVVERKGRLDLVVHGAGVLEDKLLADKEAESFQRVFDTKVRGAEVLAAATAGTDCRLVLFGSIAGVFGNKGQVDYAAANDALDSLAHAANSDADETRSIVAIDWGPWAGGGMVGAELEREYARRGIGLVQPTDGVAALLDLIAHPNPPAQTVVMRAHPEAFDTVPQAGSDVG